MNLNPRKSIRDLLKDFLSSTGNILVPDSTKLMSFSRYKVTIDGWIWGIIPKFSLQKTADVDLQNVVTAVTRDQEAKLGLLAENAKDEIRASVGRSVANRTGRARTSLNKALEEAITGTETIPNLLMNNGSKSIQAVHQSIITAAGQTAAEQFRKSIQKNLGQIVIYAREEAGLMARTPEATLALPKGTRFAYHGHPMSLYVVEEAPRVRTVLWDGKPTTLAFPYVIFIVAMNGNSYEKLWLYFRNKPLESASNILYTPAIPDIYTDGRVCYPGPKVSRGDPSEVAVSVQEMFWNSSFQTRHWLSDTRALFLKIPNFSIEKWFELSSNNPSEMLKVEWPKAKQTIGSLAKTLITRSDPSLDVRNSLSNLDRYALSLTERISVSIQEAVLEQIMDSQGPALAREEFKKRMRASLEELSLGEKAAVIIREHLLSTCDESEIAAIISQVAKRSATQMAQIITPAGQELSTAILEKLK